MKMSLTLTLFGRDAIIDCDYSAKVLIESLDRLKEEVAKPQILCYTGLDLITFYSYEGTSTPLTSSFAALEWACKKLGWRGNDIRQFILDNSEEDERWTEQRNRELTGVFYRRVTLNQKIQDVIVSEAISVQNYLTEQINIAADEAAKNEAAAAKAKKALLSGVTWDVSERIITDEGGKTFEFRHTISINGERFVIIERSVFDFGVVLNANGGGLYTKRNGEWCIERLDGDSGWVAAPISSNNAHAVEIVHRYGKYADSEIRM